MKYLPRVAIALVLLFLVIQLVPYGRDHTNPPVSGAGPNWDSPQTEATFMASCADCHSNETVWPWYSNVAPVSWLVQHDVEEGRSKFNISTPRMGEAGEAAETVADGQMPPDVYTLIHADARLNGNDKAAFIQGLKATFGSEEASAARGATTMGIERGRH